VTYINRTELYIGLIQEILNKNKDVFELEFIQNGLLGLTEDNPILAKLSLDNNFQLKSNLPDFKGSLEALKIFLEFLYKYISNLINPEDVKDRFIIIGENYIQVNSTEVLQSDLLAFIPSMFFEEKVSKEKLDISNLINQPTIKQLVIIFESIFTVYLQEAFKMDDKNLLFSEIMDLKKSFPVLNQFLITKNGDVTIIPKEENTTEKLVIELSDVFNYLVDFSSYHLGNDMAIKRAQDSITPILELLDDLPEKLGITNCLLNGALRNRIPTGIPGFDRMIQGGILRGRSIMIQASQGSEKNFFISHFIKNTLENRSNLVVVLGKNSPKLFKVQLKTLGLDTLDFENDEQFKIIDWYSWRKGQENSDSEKKIKSVIKAEGDFSDLWRAIDQSYSDSKFIPIKCAVLDILTPALNSFDFEKVNNFVQKLIKKFKDNNVTTLFLVEKDSHDKIDLAKLRVLFDGAIEIENEEIEGKANSKIRVLFMHDTNFDPEFKILTLKGTRLNISTS
jgi:KaiC/GvpD/RAD55 family RecA-like ATPase